MRKILRILIFSIIWLLFYYSFVEARGGWWGGSGWWGSWDAIWWAIALLLYAIYKIRRRKMIKKAKKDLENALSSDSSWNLDELEKVTREVFMKYQKAWTNKNLDFVRKYMTESYFKKAQSIIEKKLKWKKNILKDIQINKLTLMSVRDFPWKNWDMFAMEVSASMIDYTIDEKTWDFKSSTLSMKDYESNKNYRERAMFEKEPFKEYYIFIRYNEKWLLNNIKQKFSIIWDVISLRESSLRKILEEEKNSDSVNDNIFYTKWD